jgi:hypothetical protein
MVNFAENSSPERENGLEQTAGDEVHPSTTPTLSDEDEVEILASGADLAAQGIATHSRRD